MSFNLYIRMYSRMHEGSEGSEGYGIALRAMSMYAAFGGSPFGACGTTFPPQAGGQQSSHMRHHLRHSVKRVTGFSGHWHSPTARLSPTHRILRSLPPPPSGHFELSAPFEISAPFEPFYRACSEAFYFPLAMSILCCWGWDSGAAGAAWPAAPSAMSGIRVSRAMLILSASSEERASRHWPFTTFFA